MYILDRTDKRRLAFGTRFTFLGAHISSRMYSRVRPACHLRSSRGPRQATSPINVVISCSQIAICISRAPRLIWCIQELSQRDFASSVQYGHSSRRCFLLLVVQTISFKRSQKNVTNCSYCIHGTQKRAGMLFEGTCNGRTCKALM